MHQISLVEGEQAEVKAATAGHIYCDDRESLKQFADHIKNLKDSSEEPRVYLDCEGRDLGRVNGKLGLVQIGVEEKVYLIDVIVYPESIETVKEILEDAEIEKVVWDGRSDYSELWHGHRIALSPVLDLQLVQVYEKTGGRPGPRGFITLEGMSTAFLRHDLSDVMINRIEFVRGTAAVKSTNNKCKTK